MFIVEPKAADRLEDNISPIGTMLYGFSLFHCMTQSLAKGGPGLGTCLGPARTEELIRADLRPTFGARLGSRGIKQVCRALDVKLLEALETGRAN